jgi:hypothetical protein
MNLAKLVRFLVCSASLLLVAGGPRSASAQEVVPISGVTVTPARPGKADIARLRRLFDLTALTDQQIADTRAVYVVKVLARVPQTAAGVTLSVGANALPETGAFPGGLFVRVYDAAKLAAWAGQPVKLVQKGPRGDEPKVDSAKLPRFPAAPPPPAPGAALRTVEEVLRAG